MTNLTPDKPENHWKKTTLGKEFHWSSGGTPKSTEASYYNGGIPWAIIGDLNDGLVTETSASISAEGLRNSSAKWVEEGSVLVAMYGSIGKLGISGTRMTTNQAIAFTKPHCCSPKFLFWFLYAARPRLRRLGKGGTQSNISQTVLKQFPFMLPSPGDQQRIVEEIEKQVTRLDAGVNALERVKRKLRLYCAAVLKTALEGRLVESEDQKLSEGKEYESGEQLLELMLKERRASPHTSPNTTAPNSGKLPSLPHGWVWAKMPQVGQTQLGRQRAPQHHSGDHMRPYLRVANVHEARIDTSDVKWMNFTPAEFEKYRLEPGDILLNEGQSPEFVGRPAMYRGEIAECCYQKTLLRFRVYPGVLPAFALTVFRSYMHNGRFTRVASITTNIAHLTAEKFVEIEFPLPPVAEQRRIVDEVERRLSIIDELTTVVEANLQRAKSLRQSILQRAFSGKL